LFIVGKLVGNKSAKDNESGKPDRKICEDDKVQNFIPGDPPQQNIYGMSDHDSVDLW
jgi:hypothetical protein